MNGSVVIDADADGRSRAYGADAGEASSLLCQLITC